LAQRNNVRKEQQYNIYKDYKISTVVFQGESAKFFYLTDSSIIQKPAEIPTTQIAFLSILNGVAQ
jgi:hypothetical protein